MNEEGAKPAVSRRGLLTRLFTCCEPVTRQGRPAVILEAHCLAHRRSFCSVCVERCPEQGAILVTFGKPRIDPERCTGCGICADVCPAPGGGAIAVMRSLAANAASRH